MAWIKPNSCSCSSWSDCWYFCNQEHQRWHWNYHRCWRTLSDLQFSLTYLPAELCSSQTSLPAWKYFVFVRRDILPWQNVSEKIWNEYTVKYHQAGDLRARERSKDLLHHGKVLPEKHSLNVATQFLFLGQKGSFAILTNIFDNFGKSIF